MDTFLSFQEKLLDACRADSVPCLSSETAQFLCALFAKHPSRTKHILEIGTAHGYSALSFAAALPQAHITTIDFSTPSIRAARTNFAQAGWLFGYTDSLLPVDMLTPEMAFWGGRIISHYADAKKQIPLFPDQSFDIVFIDGEKKASLDFLRLAYPTLAPDGLVVIDDVIKFRGKMAELYDFLERTSLPHTIHQTDPDDGVLVIHARDLASVFAKTAS